MTKPFTLKIGNHLATAEKKKHYNKEVFAEIAPRYDFITRALSFWRDAAWKRDLIASLPAADSPVCADIATGTGDIAFVLARKYPQGRITGVDITEPMLDIARARNTSSNVGFVNQDMGCAGFAAGSVDIVTGGYALRNAPDLITVIDGIHRVLKPGGTAAFLDFSKPAGPLAQKLEYWLLKLWAGFWGVLFHRNHEVYSYIAESLRAYPDRDRLKRIFRDKGFEIISSRLYFFGITELLTVRKIEARN